MLDNTDKAAWDGDLFSSTDEIDLAPGASFILTVQPTDNVTLVRTGLYIRTSSLVTEVANYEDAVVSVAGTPHPFLCRNRNAVNRIFPAAASVGATITDNGLELDIVTIFGEESDSNKDRATVTRSLLPLILKKSSNTLLKITNSDVDTRNYQIVTIHQVVR